MLDGRDQSAGDGNDPIVGEAVYERRGEWGLVEIAPASCPAGHRLHGPRFGLHHEPVVEGTVLVGWNVGHGLRSYTCLPCTKTPGAMATWCVSEPEWHVQMWDLHRAGCTAEALDRFREHFRRS